MNKIINFLSNYNHQKNDELEFRFNKINNETFNLLKNKINSSPLKIIDTIFKNVEYRQRKSNEKSVWIKKENISFINLSRDLGVKLVLVKEIETNFLNISKRYSKDFFLEKNVELLRKKTRFSKNLNFWKIDITETISYKYFNSKWIMTNKEYELEFEFIKKSSDIIEMLLEIYNYLRETNLVFPHLIKYYQLTKSLKITSNNPKTLEKKDLPKLLEKNQYTMTLKLDGERKFLIDGILVNMKFDNFKLITNNEKFKNSIFDCEFYDEKIYIFDVLIFNGIDVRNFNLYKRQNFLKDIENISSNIILKKFYYPIKIKDKPSNIIFAKDIFKRGYKLLQTTKCKNDGLIFTPLNENYFNSDIFKWKEIITLDILYKNNKFFVYSKNEMIDITNEINVKKTNLINDKIIELWYNKNEKQWEFFKIRNDKQKPNSFLTFKSILLAIDQDIKLTDL